MDSILKGLKRTGMCGELDEKDIGREVCVMGWTARSRNLGSLIFVALRDRTGIVQIALNDDSPADALKTASELKNEYVIAVKGHVVARNEKDANLKMPTGRIEISPAEIRILSRSEPLPIQVEEESSVNEALKLKYRYLDLRRPEMQNNMRLRHEIARIAREYFYGKGFTEIETPMLTKSTPEGARDYLVPSRIHPGKFYALPQSPQLFKQILMISGFDKYIQIVKCFRDEDLRADRQPEFTQIDLEMSFVDVDDVIEVNEGFIKKLMAETHGLKVETPFERLPYRQAMERFGSDKPDTRFGMELTDITDILKGSAFRAFSDNAVQGCSIRAIKAAGCGEKMSRKDLDAFAEYVKGFGAKGLVYLISESDGVRSSVSKYLTEEELNGIMQTMRAERGDAVLIVSDKDETVFQALGALRLHVAAKYGMFDARSFRFLWVTDFPLLEWNEEERRYSAMHHPFTSPMDEDVGLLETDPSKVRAKAYDLVLNGNEIGGGSIRIHNTELQQAMFKTLGFSDEDAWSRFGFLLEAFKYGTPPHGGIAYGLDRLAMLLAFKNSIRDVIAFPKVQNASCLMTNSPDAVDAKQLRELHIKIDPEKE